MQTFLAVGLPFLVLMLFGSLIIKVLNRFNFGQRVRGQGPETHLKKEGIPTMGGILILIGISITYFLVLEPTSDVLWALIITLGMGFIGFLDDFKKIRTDSTLGLRARGKILGQIIIGLMLALYVYNYSDLGTRILVPFNGQAIDLGAWIIPLIVLTVIGTANGVNLTDGLDGLAAGVTAVVTSAFAVITSALNMNNLTLFALSVTGACLGFIWFNSHPAQVFMGDVGSLSLGGAIAALAVLTRSELILLIIGGVYVIETISVIVQVIYFRITGGKRILRMAPLHHHYELAGLAESKIVTRFLIISIVFASLGLISFYMVIL